jgi:multidrug efflux pump subunit AcrA (membrane-fusion protein)
MNVAKNYNCLSLVKLIGVPALCLLMSPVSAQSGQSGFVPIGKPKPPIVGGTNQGFVSPKLATPTTGNSPFLDSNVMRNSGRQSPVVEGSRSRFGGLNYASPRETQAGKIRPQKMVNPFGTTPETESVQPVVAPIPSNRKPSTQSRSSFGNISTGQSYGNSGSSDSTTGKARINVDTCSVHLMDEIMIPAKESGVLAELNVREGDAVPARKVIGTIDATLLQIELERAEVQLEVAREMASDNSSIEVAKKKYALAKHEYEVASRLASKGSRSNQERMRAKFSKDTSAAEVIVAKMQLREAMGQARVEEVSVKQIRQMINNLRVESAFDGHVLELFKHPGEWVNKGEEIAHFARIDRVWVEGTVSSDQCNVQDVMGQKTIISLKQAGGDVVTFDGTIVSIPLVMEGGGNRFRVKADVQNRFENGVWLLRPGAQLSMKIDLSPSTAKRNASRTQR